MLAADSAAAQAAGFRGHTSVAETNAQCYLLRDIVRNPFEPTSQVATDPSVRRLAAAFYAAQAFENLPVLADAVEERGVADRLVIAHLRSRATHVRGCWALDLALGKT